MTDEEWEQAWARSTMIFLNGLGIHEPDEKGRSIVDDDFLLLINAAPEEIEFKLPDQTYGHEWHTCINTANDADEATYEAEGSVDVTARSMIVLRSCREGDKK